MNEPKKNILSAIQEYFRSVGSELKKVTWPGRQVVMASTVVILVITFFVMFYVGAIDYVLTRLVSFLANTFKG